MNETQPISVIIPVCQGSGVFQQCLTSIFNAWPRPREVITVFNGASEDCLDFARDLGVKIVTLPEAVGPAQARNAGASVADENILFFVDADVTVSEDVFDRVADFFEEHPEAAALFGSYDEAPYEPNFLSQYKNLSHHYVHQISKEDASTFWGACGAIRKEVFFKLSGFDESYRKPSVEDIELGYRLKQAGYEIHLCKGLQVKHLKRWEAASLLKADIFYRAVPWTQLILRDRHFINDLNLGWSERLSVALAGFFWGAVVFTFWFPQLLFFAIFSGILLLILHRTFYRFLKAKRGAAFTLKGVLWHWFYFLYSGFGFIAGVLYYLFKKPAPFQSHLRKPSEEFVLTESLQES